MACKETLLSYDTETTGLRPFSGDRMFSYSYCGENDTAGKVQRIDDSSGVGLRRLRAFWDRMPHVAMHNAPFDLAFTEQALGRRLAESVRFEDTQLMAHVLRNDHPGHGLKALGWELAGIPRDDEALVRHWIAGGRTDYSAIPPEVMQEYQRRDAERTILLALHFLQELEKKPKLKAAYEAERDVVIPSLRMEERGFMINREKCAKLAEEMEVDAMAALDETAAVYGRRVNLGSNDLLAAILYGERRFPVVSRTSKGKPSVDKESLETLFLEYKDPLLRLAIRYRSRRRGAKILQGYLEAADENGIIHPSIKICGATTGRESCRNPNLQNVEKEGDLQNPFPTPARRVFRPRPGCINFHVDYSGIELRLLVHYSKDGELVREVQRKGGDPHRLAAGVFYPPFTPAERLAHQDFCGAFPIIAAGLDAYAEGSKEWTSLRNQAKGTNFAVPYGAGWRKACAALGLPEEVGRRRFDEYRRRFPGLCSMTRNIISTVREKQGVETELGRFIYVPRDKPYVGVNYLIQGTAAEILKRAQVRVHRFLEKETSGECRLLLPIHDELIVEWPRKRLTDAKACWQKIRELMIDFPQFNVPLEIEVEISTVDWATKEEFSL